MAWSNYETSVIRDMADLFPDLAERLVALSYKIVDLLQIVQEHVVHPEFYGSYSMKNVAPAVAQEVTYADLRYCRWGRGISSFLPHRGRPHAVACGS